MKDIIKIIKASKDFVVLIDRVTETAKTWNKSQEDGFLGALLAPLAASLVQSEIRSVVKVQMEEESEEQEKDIWIKIFSSTTSFKQYWDC